MDMELSMDIQRISNMDALLFALTLEVVLLQMRILEGCTELRSQHCGTSNGMGKIESEKITRDRQMIRNVIRRTLIEVAESGQFYSLLEAIKFLKQRALSESTKRQHYKDLRSKCHQILEELLSKRNLYQTQLRFLDQKIAILKDKINDELLNTKTCHCYTEKWLLARAEAQEFQYADRIDRQSFILQRTTHEQRVHSEIIKAYELQIKEREDSLIYWQLRYSTDTTKINQDLLKTCDQLRVVNKKRIEIQKLYDLHSGEMRSWLTFKRERAARLEREARWRSSATRIQSWWRGVMVRRAIGAFRFLKSTKKCAAKPKKK